MATHRANRLYDVTILILIFPERNLFYSEVVVLQYALVNEMPRTILGLLHYPKIETAIS